METLKLILTEDGSHSIYNTRLDEHYHSTHGAIQESLHVFIGAGLRQVAGSRKDIRILEVGFGTGLNCLLSLIEAEREGLSIHYTAFEPWPLQAVLTEALNYPEASGAARHRALFRQMHLQPGGCTELRPGFLLERHESGVQAFEGSGAYDLVYFDAFAPAVEPELWTEDVFSKLAGLLRPGGILVTYCAKGEVKRNMKKAGFTVERLPGPPGKREMTRATKT